MAEIKNRAELLRLIGSICFCDLVLAEIWLSALEVAGLAIVPVTPTDEMQLAAIRGGYLKVGATSEEADVLTERKFNHPDQIAFGQSQWRAALSASPFQHKEG